MPLVQEKAMRAAGAHDQAYSTERDHALRQGFIPTTMIGDNGAGAAPPTLSFRLDGAQSICATASAECRRTFYLKHPPPSL
jgi:hypothetical protein